MSEEKNEDVMDENGYHLGSTADLTADEKAIKEGEKTPEGLDENGFWIGTEDKEEKTSAIKTEEAKPDKKDEKKK